MCPSCNGDQPAPTAPSSSSTPMTNGTNTNGTRTPNQPGMQVNGHHQEHTPHNPRRQPFATVGDYLSNISNFKIIESTLREGEQFANAFFDTETKIRIAKALDAFGVEYIELTSPASSEQSRRDCETICKLGLKAKILTHVRCHMDDARVAVETGVDGLDIVIGTSPQLMQHSHGKSMDYIRNTAIEVIEFVKSKGLEVRFSSEDSFRSDLVDLLNIYSAVDKIGVNRVGIADTIGVANPRQVYDLVRTLRGCVRSDIETHMHNDTGCAIANSYCALEAGATHVDTSVLGIGERNGITPLGGFVARMLVADRDYVKSKYDLKKLKPLEDLVASAVEINIPFNNYVTGFCAFTHKAGIHAKAILANPTTYEIINPADFGMTRYVHFASRLTGWNAIKSRVSQLGLDMTDDQIKQCTTRIKAMADVRHLAIEDTDAIINAFYENLYSGNGAEKPLLDNLTTEEKNRYAQKAAELTREPQAQNLDRVVAEQSDLLNNTTTSNTRAIDGINGSTGTAKMTDPAHHHKHELAEAQDRATQQQQQQQQQQQHQHQHAGAPHLHQSPHHAHEYTGEPANGSHQTAKTGGAVGAPHLHESHHHQHELNNAAQQQTGTGTGTGTGVGAPHLHQSPHHAHEAIDRS